MNQAKSIIQGFYLTLSIIFAVFASIFWWSRYSYTALVGLAFFLLLAIPLITNVVIKKRNWKKQTFPESINPFLMGIQGFGLACWFLDVITTFLVLDALGIGSELNPLGWPYGIIGALFYYVPAFIGTYYLLYKVKSKGSFYGAIVLTAITVYMASLNLVAGIINLLNSLRPALTTSYIFTIIEFYIPIFVILSGLNIAEVLISRKQSRQSKLQAINA